MKLMESIAFLNGDDLLYTVSNDPSLVNNSISVMRDYGLGGFSPYAYSNFEHRVSVNLSVFETNKCIEAFLAEEEIYPITKVIIASTDAPLKTITVENIEECK